LPCLALPCLALPCLALPCLALPCLALPCLALPTLPYLTCPGLSSFIISLLSYFHFLSSNHFNTLFLFLFILIYLFILSYYIIKQELRRTVFTAADESDVEAKAGRSKSNSIGSTGNGNKSLPLLRSESMMTPTLSRPRGAERGVHDDYSGSKRDLLFSQQSSISVNGNSGSDVKIREISRRRKQAGALKSAVKNTESSKLRISSSSSTTSSMYDDDDRTTDIGSAIIGNVGNKSAIDCLDSRSSLSSLDNKIANINGIASKNGNANGVSNRYSKKIHQNGTNDEYKNEYDSENDHEHDNENEGSNNDDASQLTDPEEPVVKESTGSIVDPIFAYFNFSSFYS
jgi:ABC-type antimicrobial peptide transport system permease subunit